MPAPQFDSDARFPIEFLSENMTGGPGFMTTIVKTGSGTEQRIVQWDEPLAKYSMIYGPCSPVIIAPLRAFFMTRKGPGRGFRLRDWGNYQIAEAVDTNQLSDTTFQIVQRYVTGSVEQIKTIYAPVADTVHVWNGTTEAPSGWTVNDTTGILTFDTAPGYVPGVTCEFDIPARFASDLQQVTLENVYAQTWSFDVEELR